MTLVRSGSSSIRSAAVFKEPILSWTAEVPSRFFRAMYGSLKELLYIRPSDFVVATGVSLGDCRAALRISGGNSTLSLMANGIIAEFPNIAPDNINLANSVIFQGYEAFRKEFDEIEIDSIESSIGRHFEIVDSGRFQDFIATGEQTTLQERALKFDDVVFEAALRFKLIGKDGKWSSKVTVEKSDIGENYIFVFREIIVSNLSEIETTLQQFELIESIDLMVRELVGLEIARQDSDAN